MEDKFYCFPKSNLSLLGSVYGSESHYLSITVQYTSNDECGMSYDEYSRSFFHIELKLVIANEYIDPKNFENPIQIAMKDHFYAMLKVDSITYFDLLIKK